MIDDTIVTIRKCLDGDEKAWKLFVKDFAPLAKNILLNTYVFQKIEQDDIIQNVFEKLIRGGLKHFQGASQYEFLKYFKIIVINEAKSCKSSENKASETIHLDNRLNLKDRAHGEEEAPALIDAIQDQNRNSRPDCVVEDRDLLEKVARIMKTFPLLDQEIFLMKVKGYKDDDIKTILKIPMGTVASKYSRIKNKIAEEFGEKKYLGRNSPVF